MTDTHLSLCIELKRLGFRQGNKMRLYGEELEFLGEPVVEEEDVVHMDATEKKSGNMKRVRIPLPIVKMANPRRTVA